MSDNCQLLNKIISFGNRDERIVALILIGSQAQTGHCADEYSDIDLIVIVQDIGGFVYSNDWLSEIAKYYISFTEKIDKANEKRVLFENALDVDFIIISQIDAKADLASGMINKILCSGYRVLIDKIGLLADLPELRQTGTTYSFPSEKEYCNVVNDFWFHVVWASKKLLRGELWAAKSCLDGYMKYKLLWMIECYEHVKNGPAYNTCHHGRFIDTWADATIRNQLAESFAHYDKQDVIRAMIITMNLFRDLARDTATAIGYTYPIEADGYSTDWVEQNLCQ